MNVRSPQARTRSVAYEQSFHLLLQGNVRDKKQAVCVGISLRIWIYIISSQRASLSIGASLSVEASAHRARHARSPHRAAPFLSRAHVSPRSRIARPSGLRAHLPRNSFNLAAAKWVSWYHKSSSSRILPLQVLPHSSNPATTQKPQFHLVALARSSTFSMPAFISINLPHTWSL